MKKLFILTACVIALGSCNEGVKKAEEAAQQQRDSLEQIISQKDNEINDMMTTLSDIEEGFREITEAQNRVTLAKQGETEWRELSKYYYSDFYPLTECDKSPAAWRAWEYYDPGTDSGAIQLFRGPESGTSEMTLKLSGLGGGKYRLRNADGSLEKVVSGSALKKGYKFSLPEAESSDIIFFEKVR